MTNFSDKHIFDFIFCSKWTSHFVSGFVCEGSIALKNLFFQNNYINNITFLNDLSCLFTYEIHLYMYNVVQVLYLRWENVSASCTLYKNVQLYIYYRLIILSFDFLLRITASSISYYKTTDIVTIMILYCSCKITETDKNQTIKLKNALKSCLLGFVSRKLYQ